MNTKSTNWPAFSDTEVFRRLSDPDMRDRRDRIDDILRNLCSQGYFHQVVEYPPRDMVRACKHIFKG